MNVLTEGKKRRLTINEAKMEDAGEVMAKTNVDNTSCTLRVQRKCIKDIYIYIYIYIYIVCLD